ncbi:hypothetical protein PTMSG1_09730 [Pyrenophora teres f. maculata]|nr:hypothetical protein PTMSG1_09730 [Pyrenophora teres f. maculata]
MAGYRGSDSFAHVPSSPYANNGSTRRNSATAERTEAFSASAPPTYDESVPESRKRKADGALEDEVDDNDNNDNNNDDNDDNDNDNDVRGEVDRPLTDWETLYRNEKIRKLQHKSENLVLKARLNDKDAKIHEKNVIIYKHEGVMLEIKARLYQSEKKTTDLEIEHQKLKIKLTEAQRTNRILNEHMAQHFPRQHRPHVPTHIPHANPAIRNHPEYKHLEAPRDRIKEEYRHFRKTLDYPQGTGKTGPGRYGSNGRWDLGLCHVHFLTPAICKHGSLCEYRHEALGSEERLYIGLLAPNGPRFLRRSAEFLASKHTAA